MVRYDLLDKCYYNSLSPCLHPKGKPLFNFSCFVRPLTLTVGVNASITYTRGLCLVFLILISERISLFIANEWRNENAARWTRTTIIAATEKCDIRETTFWGQNVLIHVLCSCKTSSLVVLDILRGFPPC